MGRRHVDHERLRLHLFGNDGARKRAAFETVFFVKLLVFGFVIFLSPVKEFVEGIVALVVVCHVMLLRCRMRDERDAPLPYFLNIQEPDVARMALDEVAARLDLVAHQIAHGTFRLGSVIDVDL